MNGYIAIYGEKRLEIYAESQYQAVTKARNELKVPKSKWGLLSVVLVEKDGEQITQSTTDW